MASLGSLTNIPRTPTGSSSGRVPVTAAGGITWEELRKKAYSRLHERLDPKRNKHRPISILRQESIRAIEQFFDSEYPLVVKDDRIRLVDEILDETIGFGPLETLFRDATIQEVLVLTLNQIIVRRGDAWIPVSVSFRDTAHHRLILSRVIEQGEPMTTGTNSQSSFDVKLANGFRAIIVSPPEVMDLMPLISFTRFSGNPSSQMIKMPAPRVQNESIDVGHPSDVATPAPRRGSPGDPMSSPRLGQSSIAGPRSGVGLLGGYAPSESPAPSQKISVSMTTRKPAEAGPNSGIFGNDPYSKMRGRITQRLIAKIAAAGVYDIQQIPKGEMQRIVAQMVEEANLNDKLHLDAVETSRMTLEILTAMQV
ncbi:MAG: hypothetical protein U0798_02375 [Gemmataceae bacterium]